MQSSNASETVGISNSGQTRLLNEPINDSKMITNISEDEVLILSRALQNFDLSGNKIVNAFVPLSEMFGYSTDLRSSTQGRGTYSMEFDHYKEVPKNVSEEIIKKRNG